MDKEGNLKNELESVKKKYSEDKVLSSVRIDAN